MSLSDQTLLLLYATPKSLSDKHLARSLEQDRLTNYRRVLNRLHAERRIEYDRDSGQVIISPTGISYIEAQLIKFHMGAG